MYIQTFEERVRQLRSLMLVHSYIYYKMGSSIVSDDTWQEWADELTRLQSTGEYPILKWYDDEFRDWDGTSGFDLPQDEWVERTALYIMRLHVKFTGD